MRRSTYETKQQPDFYSGSANDGSMSYQNLVYSSVWETAASTSHIPQKFRPVNVLNFPARSAALHQKYTRGWVIGWAWTVDSNISPILS